MSRQVQSIPGFTSLSDQIYVRGGTYELEGPISKHPDTIVIYGWGDGLAKHVAKYADGYRELYPHARQVIVLSPIRAAMFSSLRQRSLSMRPVVRAVFGEKEGDKSSVLVHTMSNTGLVNYTATLHAYQDLYHKSLPHHLLVMDSTPGNTKWSLSNVARWSRAMAIGTTNLFPWAFVITQMIWGVILYLNLAYSWMVGRENAGEWSQQALHDETYETKTAHKLYLYSREDTLISSDDIELHIGKTRQLGGKANAEMFQGSGHVSHMRKFPKKYWAAIQGSWDKVVDSLANS